jgi:hypothetical protein
MHPRTEQFGWRDGRFQAMEEDFLRNTGKILDILGNLGRHWEILGDIKKSWEHLGRPTDVGCLYKILEHRLI